MKTGITMGMQDYFAEQSELLSLISGNYVRRASGELFEANVKHLFPEDRDLAKLINPGSYLCSVIYDAYSSYIGVPESNEDINDIDLKESLLSTGFGMLKRQIGEDRKTTLRSVKSNRYFYDGVEGKEYFIHIIKNDSDELGGKDLLLVQTYHNYIFSNRLFKLNSIYNLTEGEPIPLSLFSLTRNLSDDVKLEDKLERLVLAEQVERPLLPKIKTIVFSIEKKLSEIEKNFLNYTEQFKVFRNIEIPANCKVTGPDGITDILWDKLGKVVQINGLKGSEGGIDIVKNTNELLVECIKYIDKQIRMISATTGIPLHFFGIEQSSGNDSGTSKIKSSGLFYKKVERYRACIKNLFERHWEEINTPEKDRLLIFPDIVTADISEVVETQKAMLEMGVQSKLQAVMKIHNVSQGQAEKILQDIKNETTEIGNTES